MADIIKEIEKICFNQDFSLERKIIHKQTLDKIKIYLENNRFKTILECRLCFKSFSQYHKIMEDRVGYIDLVAQNEIEKIAIELDSGMHLKYKSIEKLLQSGYDILIGIIRGDIRDNNLMSENIERIKKIPNPNFKKITLIVMANKITSEITGSQKDSP